MDHLLDAVEDLGRLRAPSVSREHLNKLIDQKKLYNGNTQDHFLASALTSIREALRELNTP